MDQAIIFSTHNYTLGIAKRLDALDIAYEDALERETFFKLLQQKNFDLIILDSSNEKEIFSLISEIDKFEKNETSPVLFLVPGKVNYEHKLEILSPRSIIGLSKPFEPKEFKNITSFLLEKKDQNDKLLSTLVDLQQFAVMASHDLKSPIKNISSYIDLIKDKISNEKGAVFKELGEDLDLIRDEANRMSEFVTDLFQFSSAGFSEPKIEQVNIGKLVDGIFIRLQNSFPEIPSRILTEGLNKVFMGDRTKLEHIFQNLIENAFKYSNDGKELCLKVGASEINSWATEFSVEDNGQGIPVNEIESIFLPFRQGARSKQGTGMGLAIVKKLVDSQNGSIYVESKVGRGSKFKFTIANVLDRDIDL